MNIEQPPGKARHNPGLKKILIVVFFLMAAFTGLMTAGQKFLQKTSLELFRFLEFHSEEIKLSVFSPQYEGVFFRFPNAVVWSGVSMNMRIPLREMLDREEEISVSADEIILHMENPLKRSLVLRVSGLNMVILPVWDQSEGIARESMDRIEGNLVYRFRIGSLARVTEELRERIEELSGLVRDGRTRAEIQFSGKSHFVVNEMPVAAKLSVVEEDAVFRLIMAPEDIRRISRKMVGDDLTDAEIGLLSRHPVRAPRLLDIRDYAVNQSRKRSRQNPDISEDAYKHVLWSYLLTRRYGPEFAKRVTDAHEMGAAHNTEEDHIMDYHNNAIGRTYALKGYSEAKLLEEFLKDPDIIRSTSEVRLRNA